MSWAARMRTAASLAGGLASVLGQIDAVAAAVRGRVPVTSEELRQRCRAGLEYRLAYGIASEVVEPWQVAQDDDGDALATLTRQLGLVSLIDRAVGEARHHGRAWLWLVPLDGDDDQSRPLQPGKPVRIHVLGAPEVIPLGDWDADPRSARWTDSVHYQVAPLRRSAYSVDRVHHSRLVPVEGLRKSVVRRVDHGEDGEDSDRRERDLSVCEVYGHLIDVYLATHVGTARSILCKSTMFLKIPTGDATAGEQSSLFREMIRDLAPRLGVFGVGMLSDAYTIESHDVSLSGIGEAERVTSAPLSVPEALPISTIFGTPPAGLSTDDQGSARRWEAFRTRLRTSVIEPAILDVYDRVLGPAQRRIVWPDPAPATLQETTAARKAYGDHLVSLVGAAIITEDQAAALYEEYLGRDLPQPAPVQLDEPDQAEVDRIAAMQGQAPPDPASGEPQ